MFDKRVMQGIWAKRLEKNPKLANLPMVKGALHRAGLSDKVQAQPAKGGSGVMGVGGGPGFDRSANVKAFAKGGKVSSASKRADGCAKKGKTKGKMV